MNLFLLILSFFWFFRTVKHLLFWIYLWQLKEYHVWRFVDHFRTHKGKKLLLNKLSLIKIALLVLILLFKPLVFVAFYVLLVTYLVEFFVLLQGVPKRSVKIPVFTLKTRIITALCMACSIAGIILLDTYIFSIYSFVVWVLVFDILTPVFVSLIVLLIQPFFVMARNRILQKARKKMKQFKNVKVIAITGSYGKTTTKEFLTTILQEKYKVISTHKHQNSEMGIAGTILNDLNTSHEVFIVEMGSYAKGGISLLCGLTKPHIGMVTGVNQQHLAVFGSLENLLSAEGGRELATHLHVDGLLLVNGDNKYCLDLYRKTEILRKHQKPIHKKIYSLDKSKIDSDAWAEHIEAREDSLSFAVMLASGELAHFDVPVLGKQNVQNLLGAVLAAKELGMSLEEISNAAKKITQDQAGITKTVGLHGITIIDSSYSSNPDGALADLDYLHVFKGKKVVIMPSLIELGNMSAEVHEKIGRKIAKVCDLAIITTKEAFLDIKRGALLEGMPANNIIFSDNMGETMHKITTQCKAGDAILLEGGRPKELIRKLSRHDK